ncbi:hypothetical protein [Aestuariicoccus sp. MJ-SS9]|uniref:hypothetical protein n=1 Tax=Aestuariicoccus sp. MJ-SS9 TaxID=3079855 RepID=UPI0029145FF1|nr:hypothetical protein [Aestuariicoccus sp. MJ-SS9]MDU8913711.1 hypothetical protein [Aestuariicoccus sp. MJ-SS9]
MNAHTAAATVPTEDEHEIQPPAAAETPDANPIAALVRAMRGRWKLAFGGAMLLGPALAAGGYLAGVQLFESQAILRVFPQESNILYATGDGSVLKTFDSFVKAETSYVASHPVMARARDDLAGDRPDLAEDLKVSDLTRSIEIRRSDSLIVLKTKSKDAAFAAGKLEAVVASYLALKSEAENARSSVRLAELHQREEELGARLTGLRSDQLEVGGEFGMSAIAKAHVEKIAQIDALAARKSEVAATLATLEASTGVTSADTSDQEIMRATLLDRAMADLNFERAKLMSQLAGLRAGYTGQSNARFELKEKAKLDEIAVIETALADRREQIRVLGQTGALTDATAEGNDDSAAEIRSLYEKISGQLDAARKEARDLNRRRIELDRIEKEIDEAQALLEETRRALEVIRLESGRALPGYAVLMSPPSQPVEPADDSRKLLAAGGLAGGTGLAFALALAFGLSERRVRFAETLVPHEHRLPVLQVSAANDADTHAADHLRNELQLRPLKRPRLVGKAPVIAVTRAGTGETSQMARALAESFARARMKTLFIDADIGTTPDDAAAGWRELLAGTPVDPVPVPGAEWLWSLSAGAFPGLDDRTVSAPMVRQSLERLVRSFDIVVMSAGSLGDRLSCQFILSASDVGVLALRPADRKSTVLSQLDRLETLPRNGSVAVMRAALPGDPWLAVRT